MIRENIILSFHHFHPDVLKFKGTTRNMPTYLSRTLGEHVGLTEVDRSEPSDEDRYYLNLPNVSIAAAEGYYAVLNGHGRGIKHVGYTTELNMPNTDKVHHGGALMHEWILPCDLSAEHTPLYLARLSESALVRLWGNSTKKN